MSPPKLSLHLTSACCRKHQNTKPTSRSTGAVFYMKFRWFQTWLCCSLGIASILQAAEAFANIVAIEGFTNFRGGIFLNHYCQAVHFETPAFALTNVFWGPECPMRRTWNCGKRGHQWFFFWMYSWSCQVFSVVSIACCMFFGVSVLWPASRVFAAVQQASFGKSKCLPEVLKDMNQHHNRRSVNFHVGGTTWRRKPNAWETLLTVNWWLGRSLRCCARTSLCSDSDAHCAWTLTIHSAYSQSSQGNYLWWSFCLYGRHANSIPRQKPFKSFWQSSGQNRL